MTALLKDGEFFRWVPVIIFAIKRGVWGMMIDRYIFRAKRQDNGEWMQGCLLISDNKQSVHTFQTQGRMPEYHIFPVSQTEPTEGDLWVQFEADPATIGQCTGLRDKNGTLIFEEDILKRSAETFDCVVFWHEDGWAVEGRDEASSYFSDLFSALEGYKDYEVVGNSLDNPELLSKGLRREI